MKLYISDVGLLLVGICLVAVAWLAWKFSKKFTDRRAYRIGVAGAGVAIAVAITMWDVIFTSVKMAELCPKAGLFVKRSVKVDGFYTNFGSPDVLDRGFKYIESRSYGDRLVVYSREGDAVKKEEFDARKYQVKSRYEFIYDLESASFQGRRDIGIQKSVVRDRETKDELGYTLRYKAYPGWVDRNTIALIGKVLWMCDAGGAQEVGLMDRILIPSNRGVK